MNSVFPCPVEKCGRKFNKKEELKDHMVRRHSGQSIPIPHPTIARDLKVPMEAIHSELTLKTSKIALTEAAKTIIKKPLSLPRKKPPTPVLRKSVAKTETTQRKPSFSKEQPVDELITDEKSRENTTFYSNSVREGPEFSANLVEVNEKQDFEALMKDDEELGLDLPESPKRENPSIEQIFQSKEKLTEEFIRKKAGMFDKMELISTLVLRDEGLFVFESSDKLNIGRLAGLEYLCLSHNKLINLHGVGECLNLIELNLSFNNIEDIYPLKNCVKLEKLWLANNRIEDIKVISELKSLKLVSLYRNHIKSLDDIILVFRQLPKLEELDLDRNPATRRYLYKYDLLFSLQLSRLDGEPVSEIDYELAKSFKKERISRSKTFDDPSLQRPSTAPGKIRGVARNSFDEGKSSEGNYAERFKEKLGKLTMQANKFLNDIPEGAENYYELQQELEVVKEERNHLKRELEATQDREEDLKRRIRALETDALIKKAEANSAYILADENKSLKDKLRTYEQVFQEGAKPEAVYQEKLFIAHLKIDELLTENAKLQAQVGPKDPKPKKKDVPQFYNTFSHFPKRESFSALLGPTNPEKKRPSLNRSFHEKSDRSVEEELQKNSENIEKLKQELRSMMEAVGEENHEDSFGDNNIFDPEID